MIPLSHLDMVGVVGSSPIAPTRFGRGIEGLAEMPGPSYFRSRKDNKAAAAGGTTPGVLAADAGSQDRRWP